MTIGHLSAKFEVILLSFTKTFSILHRVSMESVFPYDFGHISASTAYFLMKLSHGILSHLLFHSVLVFIWNFKLLEGFFPWEGLVVLKGPSFVCVLVGSSRPLPTNSPCQLYVSWHDGHSSGMDGTQVGIFKESNQISFCCFM